MVDVEPRAAFAEVLGVREDGDTAGAGAGGEVIRVAVDEVEERDNGRV